MKTVSTIAALCLVILAAGCIQNIAEIKNDSHVGKTVTVYGTVEASIKIGPLSGYTLRDDSGESIAVSSETLPAEGSKITVTGVLLKDSIFGYYIKT